MSRDPAGPLLVALEREDAAADKLTSAMHALAEAEEERGEDAPDPDLPARIAAAQAAVDRATIARDKAVAERQRLERELIEADQDAALSYEGNDDG